MKANNVIALKVRLIIFLLISYRLRKGTFRSIVVRCYHLSIHHLQRMSYLLIKISHVHYHCLYYCLNILFPVLITLTFILLGLCD